MTRLTASFVSLTLVLAFSSTGWAGILGADDLRFTDTSVKSLAPSAAKASAGKSKISDGTVTLKKNKRPAFVTTTDELVSGDFSADFRVGGKGSTGAVGFVIGLCGEGEDTSYLAFDMRKSGFRLLEVDGLHNGKAGKKNQLWKLGSKGLIDLTELAKVAGKLATKTDYHVSVNIDGDNLLIAIAGGKFGDGTTVFDLSASDLGLDSFDCGAAGMYAIGNKSVAFSDISMSGTTQEIGHAPTPAALPAGLALVALLAARRNRRNAA